MKHRCRTAPGKGHLSPACCSSMGYIFFMYTPIQRQDFRLWYPDEILQENKKNTIRGLPFEPT